jgi:hypothetical protein
MAARALGLRCEEELLAVAGVAVRVPADGAAARRGERDQNGDEG